VGVFVGVFVIGVGEPVGVLVGVFVGVFVIGVREPVGVEVGVSVAVVDVGVLVGVFVGVEVEPVFWLRKTTIVCDAAYPSTIVTVARRLSCCSLTRRSDGIVYISVTTNPGLASSVMVKVPAFTPMRPEQAPAGIVTVLPAKLKVK
jgi:hypothetical protein